MSVLVEAELVYDVAALVGRLETDLVVLVLLHQAKGVVWLHLREVASSRRIGRIVLRWEVASRAGARGDEGRLFVEEHKKLGVRELASDVDLGEGVLLAHVEGPEVEGRGIFHSILQDKAFISPYNRHMQDFVFIVEEHLCGGISR